jgi:AbrB family looped-hinge helix DNA binding protein
MSDTYSVVVGDKGRIVLPTDLRQSRGWAAGSVLLLLETDGGVELITRDELERRVHDAASGTRGVVDELLAERRAEAAREDAE